MKTYKDIYVFPLKPANGGGWVFDQNGNFVFQFEAQFEGGNYAKGWKEFEDKVLDCLNGKNHLKLTTESYFIHKEGQIFIKQEDNNKLIITIRGWGNLTGIGSHNLSGEEAANIQDTFAEFIVNKLNELKK